MDDAADIRSAEASLEKQGETQRIVIGLPTSSIERPRASTVSEGLGPMN
jgi:hypothetical protein